jgi:hypothetical protein
MGISDGGGLRQLNSRQIKEGAFENRRKHRENHLARIPTGRAIQSLALAMALAVLMSIDARATLTLFRYEDRAQQHCPADTVVWLDFKKRKYYFSSQKLYGDGVNGSFVCLQEARRSRYRRSLLGLR